MVDPFRFYTESNAALATAWRADSLRSLLDCIRRVSGASIFYHFFHALRRRHFTTFEYKNDFARWVMMNFQEPRLAERLAVIDPLEAGSVRDTREQLIHHLEEAIGSGEYSVRVRQGEEFRFLTLKSFVYPTGLVACNACELADCIERSSLSSLFFHFVETRLRMGRPSNDYSIWLETALGEAELAAQINRLSPYFYSLPELRDRVVELVRQGCRA